MKEKYKEVFNELSRVCMNAFHEEWKKKGKATTTKIVYNENLKSFVVPDDAPKEVMEWIMKG